VSYDIFFQRFEGGQPASGDEAAALAVLHPFLKDRREGWGSIVTADGDAAIYGTDNLGSGVMFNHAGGRRVWDLMFEVALAGKFPVMMDVGTAVADEALIAHLGEGVPEPIVVIASGADLLELVQPEADVFRYGLDRAKSERGDGWTFYEHDIGWTALCQVCHRWVDADDQAGIAHEMDAHDRRLHHRV
jgi:hypothetical protein